MQTWEYSPRYAIRSYAFIAPFYLLGISVRSVLGDQDKVVFFFIIRSIIGLFTAYAQYTYLNALYKVFQPQKRVAYLTALLLLTAPGMFYASTSFLPSALAMSLTMLSFAGYLTGHFITALVWGTIAVVWSGWPFVAVLYIPMALHMLLIKFGKGGLISIWNFLIMSSAVASALIGVAFTIDFYYYQRL